MKILGCAMIIICSSASGIISANTILKRCNICGELMSFCELLKNEITVRQTPVCDIVNSVKMRDSFRLVSFLSDEYVSVHLAYNKDYNEAFIKDINISFYNSNPSALMRATRTFNSLMDYVKNIDNMSLE